MTSNAQNFTDFVINCSLVPAEIFDQGLKRNSVMICLNKEDSRAYLKGRYL